jgi:hypothetical protein
MLELIIGFFVGYIFMNAWTVIAAGVCVFLLFTGWARFYTHRFENYGIKFYYGKDEHVPSIQITFWKQPFFTFILGGPFVFIFWIFLNLFTIVHDVYCYLEERFNFWDKFVKWCIKK